jgi:NAD+ kinase
MLEVVVGVDGRPLSRWGCDGVVAATPTGSTAYAFSAGGPIVWPSVDALLVVPISAHALFARPMVVGPSSLIAMEVLPSGTEAVLACDGRRTIALPHGSRVEVRRGQVPVPLARTPHPRTFTDTLVEKFDLDVDGWRGRSKN